MRYYVKQSVEQVYISSYGKQTGNLFNAFLRDITQCNGENQYEKCFQQAEPLK